MYEWVEKNNLTDMTDAQEMVAGGSIKTSGDPGSDYISPTGLRSIEFLDRSGCYDHVGFRIAATYNMSDYTNISASTGLNMSFVSITDSENIADSKPFYLKTTDVNSYSSISINGLGSVDGFYRMGKYEITNSQYVKFLKDRN